MTVRDLIFICALIIFTVCLIVQQDTYNIKLEELRQENSVLQSTQRKLQKDVMQQQRIIDSLRTPAPVDLREAYPFPQPYPYPK